MTITIAMMLGFDLPASILMLVVLASAALNLALMATPRLRSGYSKAWIGEGYARSLLAFDLCQLGILLMLTGGIINPFSVLMLAPVTVAAATLSRTTTIMISLLALAWGVVVTFIALPLPGLGDDFTVPLYFRLGLLLAVELTIIFTAFYLSHMAEQSRTMASAFSSVHLALEREQRLAAIGGLAANAAHELGTPLATIAVVAKEMYKEAPEGSLKEDAQLLVEEAARCRDILTEISRSKKLDDGESYNLITIEGLIEVALERHQGDYDCPVEIIIEPPEGANRGEQPRLVRRSEFIQGFGNVIQNALQHAESAVSVTASWNEEAVTFTVRDDGPGFDPDLLFRLGDPYIKGDYQKRRGRSSMGIGVFIATTLLNHCGANVVFSNRLRTGGARVDIELPLDAGLAPHDGS